MINKATNGESFDPKKSVESLISNLGEIGKDNEDELLSLPRQVIIVMRFIAISLNDNKSIAENKQKKQRKIYKNTASYLKTENPKVWQAITDFLKKVRNEKTNFKLLEHLSTRETILNFLAEMKRRILSLLSKESAKDIFNNVKSLFKTLADETIKYSRYIFAVAALGLILALAAYAGLLQDKETKDLKAVVKNKQKLIDAFGMTMNELNQSTERSNVKYITVMETFTHIFDRVGVDVVHPIMSHLHDVSDELRQLTIVAARREVEQTKKKFTSHQKKEDEIARVSEKIMEGMSSILASGDEKAMHVFFERLFEPVQKQKDAEHEHNHWSLFPDHHDPDKKEKKKGFFA